MEDSLATRAEWSPSRPRGRHITACLALGKQARHERGGWAVLRPESGAGDRAAKGVGHGGNR